MAAWASTRSVPATSADSRSAECRGWASARRGARRPVAPAAMPRRLPTGAAGAIGLGRRQIDVEGVGQLAVSDGAPQLVEQPLRQAQIDAGDQHLSAQRFQLADATRAAVRDLSSSSTNPDADQTRPPDPIGPPKKLTAILFPTPLPQGVAQTSGTITAALAQKPVQRERLSSIDDHGPQNSHLLRKQSWRPDRQRPCVGIEPYR